MELLRGISLVAATVTMGLMAGLFCAFAYSVMPGLGRADDHTFVDAMRRINVAIVNGWFFAVFVGALAFTVLSVVLHLTRPVLPWVVAAFGCYVVALGVTVGVNVPLNNGLAAAGGLDRIADLAAVRVRFEATWVRWNVVRAVASTVAFGCLVWAVALCGRAVDGA